MKNRLILDFERKHLKAPKGLPKFRPGDTIRVHYKILESVEAKDAKKKGSEDKKKYRIQPYEGVVTRFRKGTADSTFTVRKISAGGVGVERTFPLYSPFVEKIEIIASGIVRRARLYFLRERTGKSAKIRSRYHGKKQEALLAMLETHEEPATEQVADAPATEPAKS